MTEKQYRVQTEIEQDAAIDVTMLKNKDIGDQMERSKNQRKLEDLQMNKRQIQQ